MPNAFSDDPNATNTNTDPNAEPAAAPAPAPATPPTPTLVDELVGEGKKFDSVEALAKGKKEADEHIINLQREQKELREELDKRLSAEDTAARLQEKTKNSQENTTQASASEVSDLVKKTIQEMTDKERSEANINKADAVLAEKYGEKRAEIVKAKAVELGVTIEFLEQTAATSPNAFLGMIGESMPAPAPAAAATEGSVNTDALSQINTGAKADTYKSFEELRRANPKEYFKPETQNRMMKLAAEQGESFYTS